MAKMSAEARRRAMGAAALETMASVGKVLAKLVQHMAKDPPTEVSEARELVNLVVAYQKAMQTVLDFEKNLGSQTQDGAGDGAGEIDLDGARREVLGKLARLAGEG